MRRKVLWAGAGLGALLLVLGAGLMVGARVAPATLHPPKLPGVAATFGLPGTTPTGTASPTASAIAWKQLPQAKGAFVPIKLVIEKLGVQAGVETKGIDSHNVMESP